MNTILEVKNKNILFIVAHTDDETIFFGHLINKLSQNNNVMIMAMSDDRPHALQKACEILGAKFIAAINVLYSGRDKRQYDINSVDRIKSLIEENLRYYILATIDIIVTHSMDGEYGNAYHARVAIAVKKYCEESNIDLWQRDDEGQLIIEDSAINKEKILALYRLPKPESWVKWCRSPEKYSQTVEAK